MGTYSIIYLKKPEEAEAINEILKKRYNLKYETYNGVEYGLFFSQEMFDEDLRYMNHDEEGKSNLPHFKRPISKEAYYSLIFGIGNCFGDIGTICVKISSISEKDIDTIRTLQEFSKTAEFQKLINCRKSKNLQRLLETKI